LSKAWFDNSEQTGQDGSVWTKLIIAERCCLPSESAFKKGINGWTFPAGTTCADAAQAARAAGFDALEPVVAAEGELTPATDELACRESGEQIRKTGLEVAALATELFWQTPFTAPDRRDRAAARELAAAVLDRARWLGAPVLLVVAGVVGRWNARQPAVRYEDALLYAHDSLRAISYEAEARNVVVAIENVWSRFLLSPVEMRELIDRINSPWIRVCFDVGNALKYGYPQDWIDSLGSRIVRVHVRDYRLDSGTPQGFCLPGEGDVDWPAVVAALRRMGYNGTVTYEGRGDLADISRRLDQVLAG
jgi:L-ribulose-5-phosphate 3-epimerase